MIHKMVKNNQYLELPMIKYNSPEASKVLDRAKVLFNSLYSSNHPLRTTGPILTELTERQFIEKNGVRIVVFCYVLTKLQSSNLFDYISTVDNRRFSPEIIDDIAKSNKLTIDSISYTINNHDLVKNILKAFINPPPLTIKSIYGNSTNSTNSTNSAKSTNNNSNELELLAKNLKASQELSKNLESKIELLTKETESKNDIIKKLWCQYEQFAYFHQKPITKEEIFTPLHI
jgi:hypothetical protein